MNFFVDNIYNLVLLVLLIGSGIGLALPGLRRRGDQVSTLQATQLINQGKSVLLDVRDGTAFAAGHMRDSRNIPTTELAGRIGELDKFKSKTVIVICAAGSHASRATDILRKAGFANVVSLDGGLAAWKAQGLPVTRSGSLLEKKA